MNTFLARAVPGERLLWTRHAETRATLRGMKRSPLRSLLLPCLLLLALTLPASATWSIVVLNTRTGEVAVATATCLQNFNIRSGVPVIRVGEGAAAAQSFLDVGAINRRFINSSFRLTNLTPQEILDELASMDATHNTRQYGIVAFSGPPVTFTGSMAGAAQGGVAGVFGDYQYAIQGNLLTGDEVFLAAEATFIATPGDMGQRLMAAMEAARALGGDGRCSCKPNAATSCGVPPPNFTKSAHAAFVGLARIGDDNGPCGPNFGCAQGPYYLSINVIGDANNPDPVFALQSRYDAWRAERSGRPDGILSRVDAVQSMPADGRTRRTVTVELVDIDGVALSSGGATLTVETEDGSPSLASVGAVSDHGDGSYSFELTAGTSTGTDRFVIAADDGFLKATLYPYLEVRQDAVAPLHAGFDEVQASSGAVIPLSVHEPTAPNSPYLLVGSISGTSPGIPVGDVLLPLHLDDFVYLTVEFAGDASIFPGTRGLLDDAGHAEAGVIAKKGILRPLIGGSMHWAGVVSAGGKLQVTNPVTIDVLP